MATGPREPRDMVADACASLLVPGLGQLLQGRWVVGLLLFAIVTTLIVLALALRAYATPGWFAVGAVTLVAALDAGRGARRPIDHAS